MTYCGASKCTVVRRRCVIEIKVESAFFQCARATQRASLWQTLGVKASADVPTAGEMLEVLAGMDGEAYDAALPTRQSDTLY